MKNGRKFRIFRTELDDPATAATYSDLHEKIEHFCELVYLGLIKITVTCFTAPALFASIFNYFILDLKDESFVLVSPISYVESICYTKKNNNY